MRRTARIAVVAILIVIILVITSLGVILTLPKGGGEGDGNLQVMASFYPLYFFASQVGGDKADVGQIIPDGVDSHSFEPSPSDVATVARSKLLVYNGLDFEPWMSSFLGIVDSPDLVVVDTSVGVPGLLSETAVQAFTIGQETLMTGSVDSILASATAADAQSFQFNGTVLDVRLPETGSGYGGYLKIVGEEAGEHQIFSTNDTEYNLQYPNGSGVRPELSIGYVSQYPEFNCTIRYDIATGTYFLHISSAAVNRTTIVLVAIPPEPAAPGAPEHHHGLYDPHIWLDPIDAKIQVSNILEGFKKADPANADYYHKNADDLAKRLDAIDQEYIGGLANRTKNVIVTTHEGFSYLAQRYGFQAYGATGVYADTEPSAQAIAALAKMVQDYGLHYVFAEPVYNDAVIGTIASETGAQVLVLDGIHGRTGIHAGWDYFQIMEDNLRNLRIGLEVPS